MQKSSKSKQIALCFANGWNFIDKVYSDCGGYCRVLRFHLPTNYHDTIWNIVLSEQNN